MNKAWWIGIAVVALLLWIGRRASRSGDAAERSGTPPTDAEIDGLILARRKIDAIKAYRALYGGGLKDAKDAVDARERALPRS